MALSSLNRRRSKQSPRFSMSCTVSTNRPLSRFRKFRSDIQSLFQPKSLYQFTFSVGQRLICLAWGCRRLPSEIPWLNFFLNRSSSEHDQDGSTSEWSSPQWLSALQVRRSFSLVPYNPPSFPVYGPYTFLDLSASTDEPISVFWAFLVFHECLLLWRTLLDSVSNGLPFLWI
jgi:hypothetical protein